MAGVRVTPVVISFASGEWSPKMEGRIDLPQYRQACRKVENFLLTPQGPAEFRPGTEFIENNKTAAEKVRLIPFERSDSQSYMFEIGAGYTRIYTSGARIENPPGTPVEIATLFTEAQLFEIQVAQTHDTMYLVHRDQPPHKISRGADDNTWVLSTAVVWTGAPINFNTVDLRPGTVSFYEGRLMFAGTNTHPQRIFGSKVAVVENFTVGTNDDDALDFTLNAQRANPIRWMAAQDVILLGTLGGEWGYGSFDVPTTPTFQNVGIHATHGSKRLQGILTAGSVLFVSRNGKKLRELVFSNEKRRFDATDLTLLADQIADVTGGITNIDWQTDPHPVAWCVRTDGQLLALSYDPTNSLFGWSRVVIGATSTGSDVIESVAVLATTLEDEVWISVKRTIDGTTQRYIERMKPRDFGSAVADAFFVDCGATIDQGTAVTITNITQANPAVVSAVNTFSNGQRVLIDDVVGMVEVNDTVFVVANVTGTTFELSGIDSSAFTAYGSAGTATPVTNQITGATHLEGESVKVLCDGGTEADVTIASGVATIPDCNKVQYGLGYTGILTPQRIVSAGPFGPSVGQTKRIHRLATRFFKTINAKAGPDENNTKTISFRDPDDLTDTPLPLFSGDKVMEFPGTYDLDGNITIVQDTPLPMTVVMIVAEAHVYDV